MSEEVCGKVVVRRVCNEEDAGDSVMSAIAVVSSKRLEEVR